MAGYVHINRPSSTRYVARARARGHRNYKLLCKPTSDFKKALRCAARAFTENNWWKRTDVIVIADYYEPAIVAEITRR